MYSLHCLEPLFDCCHFEMFESGIYLGAMGDYSERLVKCSGGFKEAGGKGGVFGNKVWGRRSHMASNPGSTELK